MSGEYPERVIPPRLLSALEAARADLEHRGSLQEDRNRSGLPRFRVRYFSHDENGTGRLLRSIEVNSNADVVRAVGCLLTRWKQEYRQRRAMKDLEEKAKEAEHRKRLAVLKHYCMSHGSSVRQRRQIAREFRQASTSPRDLITFVVTAPTKYSPRRAGRPLVRRLC